MLPKSGCSDRWYAPRRDTGRDRLAGDPSRFRLADIAVHPGLTLGEELGLSWEGLNFAAQVSRPRGSQDPTCSCHLVEVNSRRSKLVIVLLGAPPVLRDQGAARQTPQLSASPEWPKPLPPTLPYDCSGSTQA